MLLIFTTLSEGESMLALSTEKAEGPKGLLSNLLGLKAGVKGAQDDKFSLMLKSFGLGKTEGKDFLFANDKGLKLGTLDQEGSQKKLDPLLLMSEKTEESSKSKNTKLLSLFALGNEEAADEEQFHADILKSIPLKDAKQSIQTLIGEAKSYLKEQISQKVDIKELPKTLGGLIKLAEKSGIDIKAINFESLSKSAFSQELSQAISLAKPQTSLPHSTSQLVKPTPVKIEKEQIQRPLNALLNKAAALAQVSAASAPILDALEEPKAVKTLSTSIQTLLHGESSEDEMGTRLESVKEQEKPQLVTQAKNEALSQKITEAKQLIQNVSQSVKETVENYKPPFTRIKMQLNPQKFGDMEVTLVQRGNNVHININANTTALTVMMQNSHELKAQLSAQGLNDAQMNFSSGQQEHQQNEHKHKQENAGLTYEEFEDELTEVATALEIVVPRYI